MIRLPDILAVDGGNSKVEAVLLTRDGHVVGRGRGGAAPFSPGQEASSFAALEEAVDAAMAAGPVPRARPAAHLGVLCLAGADLPSDDRRILRHLESRGRPAGPRLAGDIVLLNDSFAVLRAGSRRSWGIAVVCGAGMNCVGVAPDGRRARYASLGELSGDEGGGHWLGVQAVRAAVRGHDGRDRHTALEEEVPRQLGVRSVQAVLEAVHTGSANAQDLRGLAPIVLACAERGDAVAGGLVDRQAEAVVAMVSSAARRLRLQRSDPDVVLGGGLFRAGEGRLLARVRAGVLGAVPAARLVVLRAPPVLGAALLGLDRLGVTPSAAETLRRELG
jgi:N-acetylglucosamine kinase-like BadF-type ATPase